PASGNVVINAQPAPPAAPVATAATAVICGGFTANWNAVSGATSYGMAVSDNINFSSNLPSYDGSSLTSGTSYNLTNLTPGVTYYYRIWAYNSCGPSADSSNMITVEVVGNPTTADAGTNQTQCETATATLAGNTATVGTGVWSLVSGAGTITTPSSPASGVIGLGYGANVFRWTISNGDCTASSSEVTITRTNEIVVASGNKTPVSCNGGTNGTITLGTVSGGTAPYVYSWSKTTDPTFTANTANLIGLSKGTYNYSVTDA
ncbi:hypothetical protein B0A75_19995, partial [Flavobacterium oncorhynchi]